MNTHRSYLLCLVALLCIGPMALHADSGPQGTYKGTVQCTLINEQYILQRGLNNDSGGSAEANRQLANTMLEQGNRDYIANLKSYRIMDANPFQMTIADGAAPGQYSLLISPANENYIKYTLENAWNPTPDNKYGVIRATWRADGFEIVRTQPNVVARIAGTFSGSQVSGQWSLSENGTQMLAGVFSATSTGGGTSGDSSKQQPPGARAGGEFKGTISSSDANSASGRIQFTVDGNSLQGTVAGQWAQAPSENSDQTEAEKEAEREAESGAFSGKFAGPVNPGTGKFEANLSGKIGDFDFTGHIRGTIQGYNASGTWDAVNQYGTSTGTWTASRPAPVIPILDASGVGGEVVDSQPPGISGVGDVPGPQDLPETGTGLLLPGLLAAAGIGLKSMLDASVTPPPMVDYGPVAPPADTSGLDDSMTDSLIDSTFAPTPQPSTVDPQYAQALQDAQDATGKYTAMQKQLADFEQGADPTDPQYAVLKKQYTDYIDYYKQKADAIGKAIEQDRNTVDLKDFKGDPVKQVIFDPATGQWHDSETGNLFDPSKWEQVQDQAAQDAAWSQADLQHMSDRQDAFSKHMDEVVRAEDQKEAALKYLEKMNKTAWDSGMADFSQAHNAVFATEKMMDDILAGKPVNVPEIMAGRRYMEDRLLGVSAQESTLSLPENQANLLDYTKTAAWNSLHELVTGRDADGHFTVAGFLGMVSLHIGGAMATGGYYEWLSEGLLTGANTVYAEKDAIDHGATDLDALGAGAWEALKTGGIQAGVGLGMHYFPNVTKGIGEMMQPIMRPLNAVGEQAVALGQRINRIPYQLKTQLFLSDELKLTRAALDKALGSADGEDLIALYQRGGMKKLGELQAQGGMSAADAKLLNARLTPMVNEVVDHSTRQTFMDFYKETKVPVKQAVIADSGSSARGVSSKVFTDADRTVLTQFDQKDVANWIEAEVKAGNPRLPMKDANEKLQQIFADKLGNRVDRDLRAAGFEGGAEDVKYSTYNGIGPSAGQPDCYGAGWTGQRMRLQGVGKEYIGGGIGSIQKTLNVSGSGVVDQNGLNILQVTGKLPENPDKFSPSEFNLFSQRQVDAAYGHLDVKSVAKAMKRESDLADRINSMSASAPGQKQLLEAKIPTNQPVLDEKLTEIAKEICNRPSEATAILLKNGKTAVVFQAEIKNALRKYHLAIGGTLQ